VLEAARFQSPPIRDTIAPLAGALSRVGADNATRFKGASRSNRDPSVGAGGNADDSAEANRGASANSASSLVVAVADRAANYRQQRVPAGGMIEQRPPTQLLDKIRF
jgi:hypothetical protein